MSIILSKDDNNCPGPFGHGLWFLKTACSYYISSAIRRVTSWISYELLGEKESLKHDALDLSHESFFLLRGISLTP